MKQGADMRSPPGGSGCGDGFQRTFEIEEGKSHISRSRGRALGLPSPKTQHGVLVSPREEESAPELIRTLILVGGNILV